ncbi:MAG: hypothetical protein CM1200mP15_19360 [Dehalococcoidia bacterium]|nr:MAG: hypothetical protein CM1200mP15_19360 [Dehalococcoidia bacterium]
MKNLTLLRLEFGPVWELTDGRGADVVMELVGRAELMAEGIDMLSNGGSFVEIGDIVRGREVSIDPSKLLSGKNILGSRMYKPSLLPHITRLPGPQPT